MTAVNRLLYTLESKLVGKLGFVYHRTSSKNLESIKEDGLRIFKDSPARGRSLYGPGLYSCYDLQSQLNNRMVEFYGNMIIRCFVKTANYFDFDAFANPKHARHKEMVEKGKLIKAAIRYGELSIDKKKNYSEGYTSELALLCYKDCMKHFDGIIFTGKQDGKTCVTYKPDTIKAQAYCVAENGVTSIAPDQWTVIGLKPSKGPGLESFIEKYRNLLNKYGWKADISNKVNPSTFTLYKKKPFTITLNDSSRYIKFANSNIKGAYFQVPTSEVISFIKNPKSWFDSYYKNSNQARALPILEKALKEKGLVLKTKRNALQKHSIFIYSKNKIPYDLNYFQSAISFDNSTLDNQFETYDRGLRVSFQKDHTDIPLEELKQRLSAFAAALVKYINGFETRYTLDYPYFKYGKMAKSNGWELSSNGDQTTRDNITFSYKKERNIYLDCNLSGGVWYYKLHINSNRIEIPEEKLEDAFKDPFKFFNHTNAISYAMMLMMRNYVQQLGYSTFTKTYRDRSVVKIRSKDKTKTDYARFELDGNHSLYYSGLEGHYLHENDEEDVKRFKDFVKADLEKFFKG